MNCLVVRDPHLHVEVDVGVLAEGGRLLVLVVEVVDPAPLGVHLGPLDLPLHVRDGLLQPRDPLLRLGHGLLEALSVHQLALQLSERVAST